MAKRVKLINLFNKSNGMYSYIVNLFQNKPMKFIWYILLVILAVIPSIAAVLWSPVNCDSSYYLSVVERINDGYLPYRDLYMSYTPLSMYVGVLLKNIFSIGISYEFFLIIHFALQYLCAYFLYKISVLINIEKKYAFYTSILFILVSHWNQGNAFLLETPSILFGLIAIYYTLKAPTSFLHYLFIGLLCSFSLLSKQYGLGFTILIMYLLLFNKDKWRQLLFLLVGFSIPIFLCLIIWGTDFIAVLSGGGYGVKKGFTESISMQLYMLKFFLIRIFPVILIGFFYLPFLFKNFKGYDFRNISFLIFGIFGFSFQFYFAPFPHYYLYLISFASILSFLLFSKITKLKWIYSIFLSLTFLFSIYSTYHNRVYKIYIKSSYLKVNQYALSKELIKQIDSDKTLYIADIGLIEQYYLTNIFPPNFKNIGYSFGPTLTKAKHLEQINSADFILKYNKEYNDFDINSTAVENSLSKRKKILLNNDIVLYK